MVTFSQAIPEGKLFLLPTPALKVGLPCMVCSDLLRLTVDQSSRLLGPAPTRQPDSCGQSASPRCTGSAIQAPCHQAESRADPSGICCRLSRVS